jgi:hypothetical protein
MPDRLDERRRRVLGVGHVDDRGDRPRPAGVGAARSDGEAGREPPGPEGAHQRERRVKLVSRQEQAPRWRCRMLAIRQLAHDAQPDDARRGPMRLAAWSAPLAAERPHVQARWLARPVGDLLKAWKRTRSRVVCVQTSSGDLCSSTLSPAASCSSGIVVPPRDTQSPSVAIVGETGCVMVFKCGATPASARSR